MGQLKQGGSACRSGGGGTPAAAAATGHPIPRHSPCDSWDSADAERSPDEQLLDNAASGLRAAAPGYRGACSGGAGTTSTEPEGQALQHGPPPQQEHQEQQQLKPAALGFSQPVSDIYELSSSSSEDEGDAPGPAGAPALVAAKCAAGPASSADAPKQACKPATPASKPGAADCPICSNSLAGLSLEQQQRHINACCDVAAEGGATKPAAVGLKQLGRQAQPQMPAQDTDTIPAYRSCFQQEQQPPAGVQQQQQQQGARQLAGAPAATAPAKAAAAAAGCQVPQLPDVAGDLSPHAPEQAAQQQQLCKVCGADLSHLRVQQQVSHVKACMAGRGGKLAAQQQQQQARPPKRQAQQMQPPAQPVLPAQQQKGSVAPQRPAPQQQQKQQQALADGIPAQAAASAPSSDLRDMGIGEWLQGLGLERYAAVFQEQEIDLTVVHAISAEELAGVGVTDRLHQARILQAAEAVARTLGLRRLRGSLGGKDGRPAAAKKQRQLTLFPASDTAGVAGGAAIQQQQQQHAVLYAGPQRQQQNVAGPLQPQQQQQQQQPQPFQQERQAPVDAAMREAAPRPQERALLASLYPAAAGAAGGGPQGSGQQPPQRTPQLAGGRTLARAAPAAASLWAGAGACMPVAPTLAARLAQREAADPEAAAARKQPLARGGTAYPVGKETRALKRVKLDALRQELATHEATVAELRRMIAGLEQELGS